MEHVILVQDFVYSSESLVEERQLCAYEKKIGFSKEEFLKYHETANFYVCRELYK